jgi:hypothetical protein
LWSSGLDHCIPWYCFHYPNNRDRTFIWCMSTCKQCDDASHKTTIWIIGRYAENLMLVITFILTDNLMDLHWSNNVGIQNDLPLCIFKNIYCIPIGVPQFRNDFLVPLVLWKQPIMLWYIIFVLSDHFFMCLQFLIIFSVGLIIYNLISQSSLCLSFISCHTIWMWVWTGKYLNRKRFF